MVKYSIIVLFYNEEANCENTVSEIREAFKHFSKDYEIVAVQNGSTDRTHEILNRLKDRDLRIVIVPVNKGYGYGVMQGMNSARGRYAGWHWGDNQVPAKYIVDCFREIEKDSSVAMVKITRAKREDGWSRKIVTIIYNIIFKVLYGVSSNDMNGCPKVMNTDTYRKLNLVSLDFFVDPEVIIKMGKYNLKFKELPCIFRQREGGKSSFNIKTIYEFASNMVKYRLKNF